MTRPAPWQGRPPVSVCVDVDAARVVELIMARLAGPVQPAWSGHGIAR